MQNIHPKNSGMQWKLDTIPHSGLLTSSNIIKATSGVTRLAADLTKKSEMLQLNNNKTHYNATKGEMDTLDQLLNTYTCKKKSKSMGHDTACSRLDSAMDSSCRGLNNITFVGTPNFSRRRCGDMGNRTSAMCLPDRLTVVQNYDE
ncbi:hypothetical protein NPIL_119521 [Nephila pilipes]|uniref:Uncharacterized protein n=1 Tax=Nephila pilipes TaxID=299642 RepID=A0A8X6TME3_NEPPI|nr:hypothetical protein NPIL_119521 [Nephila pilipes]